MLKDRDEVENERLRMKEDRLNQPIQEELERVKKNYKKEKKMEGGNFRDLERESRRETGENRRVRARERES